MTYDITARHVELEGIKFDSVSEAKVYQALRQFFSKAEIACQFPIRRDDKGHFWRVDFCLTEIPLLVEYKGVIDKPFRSKMAELKRTNLEVWHKLIIVTSAENAGIPISKKYTCTVQTLISFLKSLGY